MLSLQVDSCLPYTERLTIYMLGLFLTLLPALATTTIPYTTPVVIMQSVEVKTEVTEKEIIINKIKEVFGKDADIAIKVATCESSLRQFDDKGQVVKSKTGDSGLFQINQVHKKQLDEMKLDPDKLEDNIKYAKHLFDRNGLRDWSMSKHCWSK